MQIRIDQFAQRTKMMQPINTSKKIHNTLIHPTKKYKEGLPSYILTVRWISNIHFHNAIENPTLCWFGNKVHAWCMCKYEVLKPVEIQICNTLTVHFINILRTIYVNARVPYTHTLTTKMKMFSLNISMPCNFVLVHHFFTIFHLLFIPSILFRRFHRFVVLELLESLVSSSSLYLCAWIFFHYLHLNFISSTQFKLVSISWSNRCGCAHFSTMLQQPYQHASDWNFAIWNSN